MKKFFLSIIFAVAFTAGTAGAALTTAEYDNALDMANLSARVYDALWDEAWDAVAPLLFPGLDFEGNTLNFQVIEAYTESWDGFDAKLYYNTDNGEYVLVFRGTQPFSLSDWLVDLAQVLNDYLDVNISQYEKAVALALDLKNQHGGNLQITGHSLGGGLAQVAGLATGLKTTCFEAAGISRETFADLGISDEMIAQNSAYITHFNVQYDMVSDLDGKMNKLAPFPNTLQYGDTTYWLDNLSGTGGIWNPLRGLNHFYHTFVYQLDNKNFL